MKTKIKICLGQEARPVGHLYFEVKGQREAATFVYDQAWLEAADRFALEPGLPLIALVIGQQHLAAPNRAVGPVTCAVEGESEHAL